MKQQISKFVQQCAICQVAKETTQNSRLYSPLPILTTIWEDLSMNFVVGLSKTQWHFGSILIVIDHFFLKWLIFFPIRKPLMQVMSLIYSFKRLNGFMEFQNLLPVIVISSLWATFGECCKRNLTQSWLLVMFTILKLMVKLRLLTKLLAPCFEVWQGISLNNWLEASISWICIQ